MKPKPLKPRGMKSKGLVREYPQNLSNRRIRAHKGKEKSISKLMKELDRVFSLYVRTSNANSEGMVQCYTCAKFFHYKKIHAGHYLSRFYKSMRWDERQVKPQCMMDNLWKRGDPVVFRENLVAEYGEDVVRQIELGRHQIYKLDKEDLKKRITHYASLIKNIG